MIFGDREAETVKLHKQVLWWTLLQSACALRTACELQQDVSMGSGQPGSPQGLSASGIKQARGNGLSINVSINCGEALVYYPFQLSGLAE